jgi:hypothetical protein
MSEPEKEVSIGPCSYCGEDHELEPEHVVPRAIFVNGNQSSIVIPACHHCNNEKSAGEDDLRDYLVITIGVHGHDDIVPLMAVMAEATGKGFSKIGRAASEERKPVLQRTDAGVVVPVYEVPIHDVRAMERTLRCIARGLYFYENGRPWPADPPMSLHILPPADLESTLADLRRVGPVNFRNPMGNDVFKYAMVSQPEHPGVTAWAMVFFGRVLVIGITGIPEPEEERREPTFQELIRRKGRRERHLRRIVDRRLVMHPPDDLLGFLHWHEERKKRTPPE